MLRDNTIIFKAEKDDEFILGTANQLAEILNVNVSSIRNLVNKYKIHGYKVTKFGYYRKLYEVYDTWNNDVLYGKDVLESVAKLFDVCEADIALASAKGFLVENQYRIVQKGHKVVDEQGRLIDCDY